MTRISDLALQQILLSGFQRAQGSSQLHQIQLSSGKVSDRYGGVAPGVTQLLSAEGVVARATAHEDAANLAATRLQTQEAALVSIEDSVARLGARFVASLATGGAELLFPEIAAETQRILSALNTESGGVYVFGGVDGAAAPVGAASLDDLAAAADATALFSTAARARLPVEEGTQVDGGATAREVGLDLVSRLKELADAATALGPWTGAPTQAQADFLRQKIQEFAAIGDAIREEEGLNGLAQSQTEDARLRNVQRRDLAEIVAAEIEDVDIAEVASRLNQDRIAIEAAARALSQASELSLLNFL